MKRFLVIISILTLVLFGCNKNEEQATISVVKDSENVQVIQKMGLGELIEFQLKIPDADKKQVTFWVERYEKGVKDEQPILELVYGMHPNEYSEENIGFGIININSEEPLGYMYTGGVALHPQIIPKVRGTGISSWLMAINEDELELPLGETKILAAHRNINSNLFKTLDLNNEDHLEKMINEDGILLLVKIKIEDADQFNP